MAKMETYQNSTRYIALLLLAIFTSIFAKQAYSQCYASALSPSSISATSAGGQYTIAVSTGGCITYNISNYTSFATYSKNGLMVTVTIPANTGSARSGMMLIGNRPLSISQACGNYPATAGSISGSSAVCRGQSGVAYSVAAISGATGYSWTLPSGASIASGSNTNSITVNFSTSASSGNITVRGTNSCGNGGLSPNHYVAASTFTQPGSISGSTSVCSGSTHTYSISTVSGATSYHWTIPAGASGSSSTNSINITFGSNSGTISVTAENSSGCISDARTLSVNISTLNKYNVTGGGTICPGETVPVGLLSSTSGIQYKCYLNGSYQVPPITGTGSAISFGNKSAGGTYTVYGVTSTGCEVQMLGSVTINAQTGSVAATSINATTSSVCPGSSTTLSVIGGSLGTNASWKWYTGGCGTTLVHTGSSYTVTPSSTTTYYLRAEGTCGQTECVSKTITVKTLSTNPTGINPSNPNVCPGSQVNLSVVGGILGTDASWKWYSDSNGSNYVGTGTSISVYPINTTTYFVRAEGCNVTGFASTTVYVKTLSTAPTQIHINNNDDVCPGEPVLLSINDGVLGSDATWHWYSGSAPCGSTSVGTGSSVSVNPSSTTTYFIRAESVCGNTTCVSGTVTTKAATLITSQPTNSTVVLNQNSTFSVSASGPSLQYQWESSSTAYGSWTSLSGPPAVNYNTATLTIQGSSEPVETKFYRCKVHSECTDIYSNPVSLTYLLEPNIVTQPDSYIPKANGSSADIRAYANNGVDWKDINSWSIGGPGEISWDESKQAWKCVGYIYMYIKYADAIPIDVNRSYTISIEAYRENDESKYLYWGGKRLASNKTTVLSGYGGSFDYSATTGHVNPTVGQWTTYKIETKTGTSSSYSGWLNDGCAYYAVGGLINYNGTNTQVTYIRNIEFYETGEGYTYQWKKDGSNISGANSPDYVISSIGTSDEGSYTCLISGTAGSATSDPITLDVKDAYETASVSSSKNYIYVQEPIKEVKEVSDFSSLCYDEIRQSVNYFDGLGRLDQSINIKSTPSFGDLVSPSYYDEFGRESIKYLPFAEASNDGAYITDARDAQGTFYNGSSYFPNDTANAKTVFENSPLNRILEQGAPGRPWQPYSTSDTSSGHTQKFDYGTNSDHDVLIWKVNGNYLENSGGVSYNSQYYYPAHTLYKTVTQEENHKSSYGNLHTTEEFKDKKGQVILKRNYVLSETSIVKLETYYVYDDFGHLRYVLPPKAVSNISSTAYSYKSSLINGLGYYYKYDKRGRMIFKQLPGADSILMVYDNRDRLILTQDGNNRTSNKWLFTKYDRLNRPVLTGILTYGSSLKQYEMQAVVDNVYSGGSPRDFYVDRNSSISTTLGFTDTSFPNSGDGSSIEYLSATYYDNYDFIAEKDFDANSNISSYTNYNNYSQYNNFLNGIVTGTCVKVLGTSDYITSTNYYDDHNRMIQSLKNLYDDSNGSEIIANKYDFIGEVIENRQKQTFNSISTDINKYYSFDQVGRLIKAESEINGNNRTIVSESSYNELGQLSQKSLNKVGSTSLQDIDYSYTIRGWLNKINNPDNLGSDLFSMKLLYEDATSLTNLVKENQFNGNISAIIWNRNTDQSNTKKSAYAFRYDALNRLVNNYYGEDSSLTNSNAFREFDYSYDENGNIQVMKRNNNSGSTMDNLSYTYLSSLSNQLASVSDNSGTSGFNDGNTSGNDYSYDKNGNLTKDLNKGIGTITYNFLNLPQSITKDGNNNVTYYYDAMGTKLKQVAVSSGTTTTRYYFDGIEYQGNALDLIHMDEGVINYNSGAFIYEYFIKDHLGNTRIALKSGTNNSPVLTQTNDYYPFGLSFSSNTTFEFTNKYLYNGKELQDVNLDGSSLGWYDYQARMYDPALGRFHSLDPKAYMYFSITPYNYVSNNPIAFIDPDGKVIKGVNKDDAQKTQEDLNKIFESEKFEQFRSLLTLDKKGKTFNSIDADALTAALDGADLSEDEQALVDMVVNTINSEDVHLVEFADKDENISSTGQSIMSGALPKALVGPVVAANGGLPASIISAFGGSGVTTPTKNGTYSLLIEGLDATKSGSDYLNSTSGTYVNNPGGRAATTGHEIFGHGRSLAVGRTDASSQHVDAIKTENLILRVMGHGNVQRTGTGHAGGTAVPNASGLPGFR